MGVWTNTLSTRPGGPLWPVGAPWSQRSREAPATFCTHTPCSDAYPERELLEMCLVLTDDTRLARPERLEEVEGVCRRWTCDGNVTQEQTRTKWQCDCCSCCLYSRSGCATVHPWERHRPCRLCSMVRQKAPQWEAARMCLDRCYKSSPGHGAAPVAGRAAAAAAVDLCDGCAQKLWIRWSVIAHACKNCVRVLCLSRWTRKYKQWRYSEKTNRRNTSNDDTLREAHKAVAWETTNMSDESGLQPRIRRVAAAARARGKTHQTPGRSRGHRPTCDWGKNQNADTEQRLCLDQCVLSDGCYKAGLAPTRAYPRSTCRRWSGPKGGCAPTKPRTTSCSPRRHARTCTETSRRARCRRRARARCRGRAPLWIDTKNGCLDQAMRVQCSSSCFTHHQCLSPFVHKKKAKINSDRKIIMAIFWNSGVFCNILVVFTGIGGRKKKKTPVGDHYGRHGN